MFKNKRVMWKCILSTVLVFALLLTTTVLNVPNLFQETVSAAESFTGDGTSESPYIIDTAEQLAYLAERLNAGDSSYNDKCYKLGADIDLSYYGASNTNFNDGKGWIPIGMYNAFKGVFDGDGKTISGLYINDKNLDNAGLFGLVIGGNLKNLGIMDANITGKNNVGGVVGKMCGSGSSYQLSSLEVSDVSETPSPIEPPTPRPTPGITPGYVTNCYVTGTITGDDYVGGIAGYTEKYFGIHECYTIVSVNGINYVGGILGYLGTQSGILDCYANSFVNSTGSYAGGVVGFTQIHEGVMTKCYATGAVNGASHVGGVVGSVAAISWVAMLNLVALNSKVSATDTVGRVIASESNYVSLNSYIYAYDNMTIKINGFNKTLDKGADKKDGADITAEDILTASFWTEIAEWDTTVWTIEDGKLPILTNTGGVQPGEFAVYNAKISSISPDEGNSKVTVNLENSESDNAVLIVAIYSEGMLLNFSSEAITQSCEMAIDVAIPQNADTIKAVIWNDLDNIKPLCLQKEIKKSDGVWSELY